MSEMLYCSELPTTEPVLRRRHGYEAILVARPTLSQHERWIRALQRRLRRQSRKVVLPQMSIAWPVRYRLGEVQRFCDEDGCYETVQGLTLLIHNRQEAIGFCAFSVGAGTWSEVRGCVQVCVDALWIAEHERGQRLSEQLAGRLAEVTKLLACRQTLGELTSPLLVELHIILLTQSGFGFLKVCEQQLHKRFFSPLEVSIEHSSSELERVECLLPADEEIDGL